MSLVFFFLATVRSSTAVDLPLSVHHLRTIRQNLLQYIKAAQHSSTPRCILRRIAAPHRSSTPAHWAVSDAAYGAAPPAARPATRHSSQSTRHTAPQHIPAASSNASCRTPAASGITSASHPCSPPPPPQMHCSVLWHTHTSRQHTSCGTCCTEVECHPSPRGRRRCPPCDVPAIVSNGALLDSHIPPAGGRPITLTSDPPSAWAIPKLVTSQRGPQTPAAPRPDKDKAPIPRIVPATPVCTGLEMGQTRDPRSG